MAEGTEQVKDATANTGNDTKANAPESTTDKADKKSVTPRTAERKRDDPRVAMRALRARIQTDGVFGAAEGVELLTLMIGDGKERQADDDAIPNPPQTDN